VLYGLIHNRSSELRWQTPDDGKDGTMDGGTRSYTQDLDKIKRLFCGQLYMESYLPSVKQARPHLARVP
jgi:hypothetical protein